MKTDSSPEASFDIPDNGMNKVNTISAEHGRTWPKLKELCTQEQGAFTENRSEKRKRDQSYDPDEVTQPVSTTGNTLRDDPGCPQTSEKPQRN